MTSSFSVPSDWYKTFFNDAVVRFWDAVIPARSTQADIAYIKRYIGVPPPAALADIPCGTGRHAVALAEAGFKVTALDGSSAAIQRARATAGVGICVNFQRADMLKFKIDTSFDGLICIGNSIGYVEPAKTQKLLRRFASTLRPGGRLILDTAICAESLLPITPQRRFSFPSGEYEQQISYDTSQSLVITRARLTIDGARPDLLYRHFVMTSGELVRMFGAAGLDVIALHGDTDDAAFAPGSPRLLIVAIRNSDNATQE